MLRVRERRKANTRRAFTLFQKMRDRRDFMQHAWKPLLASVFCITIAFDFIVAPAYVGIHRMDIETLIAKIEKLSPEAQKQIIDHNFRPWKPLTLSDGVGLFYLSIGSILTGVAVFGHRGKTGVSND